MKLESTLPETPGFLFVVPAFNLFALLLVFFLLGPSFVSQSGVAVELPVSRFQMERQADATVVTIEDSGAPGVSELDPPTYWVEREPVSLGQLSERLDARRGSDTSPATTVLLPERPTPDRVLQTLKTHQPTVFFGVPTLYTAMLAAPDTTPANGSARLRLCVSAGEALPAEIGKGWKARMGVDILDGVGSTEMLHIYVSNRRDDIRYGTSGKPVPGYDIRLIDESGAPTPVGEVGEMIVKGPTAAEGYWNQREKSRRTFEGEWMRTGDKYTCDADGYYTYAGRTDDMFKVSGIWVSPFEV
jgi:acyl-CoA synthetase (AMP-forming)/AMP-acid ligase II